MFNTINPEYKGFRFYRELTDDANDDLDRKRLVEEITGVAFLKQRVETEIKKPLTPENVTGVVLTTPKELRYVKINEHYLRQHGLVFVPGDNVFGGSPHEWGR